MTAWLRLVRPHLTLTIALGFFVTVLYAVNGKLSSLGSDIAWATASVFLLVAGGYVLNDVLDIEHDRITRPDRPLPSGRVSRRVAFRVGVLLLAASAASAPAAGWVFFAVLMIDMAAVVLYDVYSKRMPRVKALVVTALVVTIYPLALACTTGTPGPRRPALFYFPFWLFFTIFAYELAEDSRDVRADRIAGRRPLPAALGPRMTRTLMGLSLAVGVIFAFLPWRLGICGTVYFAFFLGAVASAAAAVAAPRVAGRTIILGTIFIALGTLFDVLAG
jgi:geranylgeranylglycerol-phosphate geranylgeranyltransferase